MHSFLLKTTYCKKKKSVDTHAYMYMYIITIIPKCIQINHKFPHRRVIFFNFIKKLTRLHRCSLYNDNGIEAPRNAIHIIRSVIQTVYGNTCTCIYVKLLNFIEGSALSHFKWTLSEKFASTLKKRFT